MVHFLLRMVSRFFQNREWDILRSIILETACWLSLKIFITYFFIEIVRILSWISRNFQVLPFKSRPWCFSFFSAASEKINKSRWYGVRFYISCLGWKNSYVLVKMRWCGSNSSTCQRFHFSIYVFLCSIPLKFRQTCFVFHAFYLNIQQAIKIAILLGNSFVGNRVKSTKSYD